MATDRGATFGIDAVGWREFAQAVRRADPKAQRLLLKAVKKAADGIAQDVKRAAGFSSRIPGSVRVSATQKGVAILAGGKKAPHAAAFENGGVAGEFRHPVFGNREVWVSQPAHPFLANTVKQHESDLGDALEHGVDDWVNEMGAR